ncbi:MAG: hypothetical protein ACOVLD_05945, partial [Bacteroidia bacterium]
MIFCLSLFSCKKDEETKVDFDELTFNERGKDFSFKQTYTLNGETRYVTLSIPAGAINTKSTIEYYSIYCDTNEFTNHYVNWWRGDVNFFCCSATTLSKPVTIKLPMPWGTYSASNSYKPYKLKLSKNKNAATEFNNPANRELITNYTWDNTNKCIIFET